MKVAIDGPAGSGKSTVAREVARRRGISYLDTGAMYRAVTLAVLERGEDPGDAGAVARVAREVAVDFAPSPEGTRTLLDGEDVSEAIREPRIDAAVSAVAALPEVREAMVARQRELGAAGDVVAEGRDTATTVFPDAEVKVFLTADDRARAHRRAVQRTGHDAAREPGASADAEAEERVLAEIRRRDELDSTREASPLRAAEDAVRIDTSELTVDEVCTRIEELMDAAARPRRLVDVPRARDLPREGSLPLVGNSQADYTGHGMMDFPWPVRLLYRVAAALVAAYTYAMWRWEIDGEERLYRTTNGKGSVIVMNHVSMLDPCVLVLSALRRGRRARPVYKSEFDDMPALGWLITRFGGFPVRRDSVDMRALRSAKAALERGECVVIFPEGTRVKSDDEPVTVHGGFAMIAQMAGADVVPAAIVGARDITPRGRRLPRPGKVWLKVGEPIPTSSIRGRDRKRMVAEVEERAMGEVYALRDELRREHPGKM